MGWPGLDEIAARLAFTTQDHRSLGLHTLVLHSRDLPDTTDEAKRKLAEFVDQVFIRLKPPTPHSNHFYWRAQKDLFDRYAAAMSLLHFLCSAYEGTERCT